MRSRSGVLRAEAGESRPGRRLHRGDIAPLVLAVTPHEVVEPRQRQPEPADLEDDVEAFDFAVEPSIEPEHDLIAETTFQPVQADDPDPAYDIETDEPYIQDLVVDEMEPLEEWEYDESWEEEAAEPIAAEAIAPYVEQPTPPARRDSPRGSWWRSLNFGIKRRYQPDPEPVEPVYEYDDVEPVQSEYMETAELELSYDDVTGDGQFADDDLYWHESPVEPAAEEAWRPEEVVDDEIFEDELPLAGERHEGAGIPLATSDESWLMDAREFPAPQPAEWHQSRTHLLAQRQEIEPIPQVRPERREPVDQVEWIEPRAAAPRHVEEPRPRRRPEPREYIPIDQPSGMDAFRNALFGGTAANGLIDTPEPRAPRVAAPPTTFDKVDHEPAPRQARWDSQEAYFVPDPEPETWMEAEVEPVAARPVRLEQTDRRESRRGRSSRPSRDHDRRDDEIFDIRRAVADPDDTSITRQLDVENGVAKCCLTCRSFQPGDEAGRGWCMNSWAGTYRQMVNADTLACQSSIGHWWIAADTTWIPPSDSIQPRTPRTDRLVARADSRDERESSKRSRVRTGKVG